MRVGGMRAVGEARAAVRRAMPPFDRVAFDELMRGVQQNLRAGALRREMDERQHVLQLVAIAGRRRSAAPGRCGPTGARRAADRAASR